MGLFSPTFYEDSIFDIDLKKLKENGIKLIITDIDNTLVPYGTKEPTKRITKWLSEAENLEIKVCLLSNNDYERVDTFNKSLGFYAISKANKPLPFSYLKCIKHHGVTRSEAIFFGDQLFTDMLGARLAGIKSVLVKPIRMDNESSFIAFKRKAEQMFLKKILPIELGVIGNPIKHSKSPVLHKSFYDMLGINARYRKFQPAADELPKYIEYFKQNGFLGFNVTVPYKTEIIKYLDFIHPNAEKIMSVNTVKIKDGKLYGYSTDGDGFVAQAGEVFGKTVKIIGAGGTVPSILQSLIDSGVKEVIMYNRTYEKAVGLAKKFENVTAMPLSAFVADNCDVLINATSCEHITGTPPVDNLDGISPNTVVFDVNYKPSVTKFMQLAADSGCVVHNGLGMLVNQGLLAHKIWFDTEE